MHSSSIRLAVALAVVAVGIASAAQAPVRDAFVLTPTDAFLLGPPEVAAGPVVRTASCSK